MVNGNRWLRTSSIVFAAALGLGLAAAADFEVTGPDGRRILLKDDGTWQYLEGKDKGPGDEAAKAKEKPKSTGEAIMTLERRLDGGGGCIFGVRLTNSFSYPIDSFVPTFSAIRSNDIVYHSVNAGFQGLRPGDGQSRELLFRGISCQEIVRVQVSGGERCVMGDLDRFSQDEGECLKRVRVIPASFVRFDK